MNKRYRLIAGFLVASYWLACAPKKFEKDVEANKCQNFAQVCVSNGLTDDFEYSVKANGGLVDILFVADNSGSMSFEQAHMAQKFTSFLSQLDARYVDYRIGIITTDVSSNATVSAQDDGSSSSLYNEPRAINKNGALQDGNLISFKDANGSVVGPFLSALTSNKEQLFSLNIQRQETQQCENYMKQYPDAQPPAAGVKANCASSDERGIFAANLFFDKNPSSFIRPNAHLAVVFLADEDVRSGLYRKDSNFSFQLEANDQPATLVDKVRGAYAGKTLSIHSIIVRPGDQSCLSVQSNQMGPAFMSPSHGITFNQMSGTEGFKYAEATQLTNGVLGDICANDYGSQLANMSANIVDRLTDINLACADPSNLSVTLNPVNAGVSWNVSGSSLHFSDSLQPGTDVKLKYSCPTL